MNSEARKLSFRRYREKNYSSVTNPQIKDKIIKQCTLCPANYHSTSKFDRFCDHCRRKASSMG